MASEGLRYPSNGRVLQKPYRGFSRLVFDLPPNPLASTASSQRSFWSTMIVLGKTVR